LKFFLDTEFWDDGSRVWPISIGIVREDGREYYAECNEGTGMARQAEWIHDHVTPHLLPPTAAKLSGHIADEVRRFVGDTPAEFWAYWAAYDWVVFCQLMGGLLKLPKNISPWVRDLAWLDPSLHRIRALKVHNPKPHHALYDARELCEQYMRLSDNQTGDV
jgi:3' exoribonuclease, RNase T-like